MCFLLRPESGDLPTEREKERENLISDKVGINYSKEICARSSYSIGSLDSRLATLMGFGEGERVGLFRVEHELKTEDFCGARFDISSCVLR